MFEGVELGFNRCVFNVIGCLSLLFFRLNSRWPLILWTLTIVAARESRSLSTWMARVPMKRAPIPRRCPLCLPFLFGVSTDACVSTRGCAVTYRGCFPHCSIASVLESNLHFFGVHHEFRFAKRSDGYFLMQLLRVHFENWYFQTSGLWNAISLPSSVCRKLMDKQTFCSSQAASNVSRYAAAIYKKGKFLLLNPHSSETYSFQC